MRSKIEKQLFMNNIKVTASFGVACMANEEDLMNALEMADKRLYSAKNNGRNRICFEL